MERIGAIAHVRERPAEMGQVFAARGRRSTRFTKSSSGGSAGYTQNYLRRIECPAFQELAAPVKLLLMDVDGVLTDGRLYQRSRRRGKHGRDQGFDSQDGIALQWLNWKGIKTGLISGRVFAGHRWSAPGSASFTYIYQGHIEKIPILDEILADAGVDKQRGGLHRRRPDRRRGDASRRSGHRYGERRAEVKQEAHYVTHAVGGSGAVREVVELILKAQGCMGRDSREVRDPFTYQPSNRLQR